MRVDLVTLLRDDRDLSDLVEQPLGEPVDLRRRRLASGEDAEVHANLDRRRVRRSTTNARADRSSRVQRGVSASGLRQRSRGCQRKPRIAAISADHAPEHDDAERAGSLQMWWWRIITSRVSFVKYVSGRTSAIARRNAGYFAGEKNVPEMIAIGR